MTVREFGMNFKLQFLVDQVRMLCLLFLISGILIYAFDYRKTKNKPQYKRERAFSKTVSYIYVAGAILTFMGAWVFNFFL